MKVWVTGAAGRLGRAVCQLLREAGYEVRGTDVRYDREAGGDFRLSDLRSYMDIYEQVQGMDAVVHLGNYPNIAVSRPPQIVYAENSAMNVNVFQAAAEVGVRRIVFASSIQAMCGDREAGSGQASQLKYLPIDGASPHNAGNLYGLSKIAGEVMLGYYVKKFPDLAATALRFPFFVQANSNWRLSRRFRDVRPGIRLDEGFAYLFFSDAARLILDALTRQRPGYHCYLPAAMTLSIPVPVPDLIRDHFQGVELRRLPEEMTSLVDNSEITRDLGWEPRERLPIDEDSPATLVGG